MKKICENLFYEHYLRQKNKSELIKKLEAEIERNNHRLKENFSKTQKKLLLRIIDAKDSIAEENNKESFVTGFKLGLRLGYEVVEK